MLDERFAVGKSGKKKMPKKTGGEERPQRIHPIHISFGGEEPPEEDKKGHTKLLQDEGKKMNQSFTTEKKTMLSRDDRSPTGAHGNSLMEQAQSFER